MMFPLTCLSPTEHYLSSDAFNTLGWLQVRPQISFTLSAPNLVSLPSKLFKINTIPKEHAGQLPNPFSNN